MGGEQEASWRLCLGSAKKAGGTHLKLTTVAYARGASTRLHCLHRFHQNRKGTEEVVQARRTDSEVFGGQHRPDLVGSRSAVQGKAADGRGAVAPWTLCMWRARGSWRGPRTRALKRHA